MKASTVICLVALISNMMGCYALRSNVTPDTRLSARRQGFVSKTKPEAVPPSFSRILVVLKARQASDDYANQFVRAFPAGYHVCTLALNQLQPAGHTKAIQEQVAACGSDVILTVELVRQGSVMGINAPDGDDFTQFTFDLRSVATGETFWKAVSSTNPLRGDEFPVRTLLQRLRRDGVIGGNGVAAL